MSQGGDPGSLSGYDRWRTLPRGRRRQLARGGTPPRDEQEAEALLALSARLRGWAGLLQWAAGGLVGAAVAAGLVAWLFEESFDLRSFVVFLVAFTVGGWIGRLLQARRLQRRATEGHRP